MSPGKEKAPSGKGASGEATTNAENPTPNADRSKGSGAEPFLKALAPNGSRLTWQTFDDGPKPKRGALAQVLEGPFSEVRARLDNLNRRGAGVFLTVNECDGARNPKTGQPARGAANVVRVRALFVDLDGAPLEPVTSETTCPPQIITESSPDRWHAHWLVSDCALGEFSELQKTLARKFGGDEAVSDLSRVMRVPGFLHRKAEAFLSRLVRCEATEPYTVAQLCEAFGLRKKKKKTSKRAAASHDVLTVEQVTDALHHLKPDDRKTWLDVGIILGRAYNLADEVFALYDEWAKRSKLYDPKGTHDHFYKDSQNTRGEGHDLNLGTFIKMATEGGWEFVPATDGTYVKFWAVRPANKYLYLPSGALWPAESVNALLPPRRKLRPALWLMQYQGVDSVVFDPELQLITPDKVAREQGVVEDKGSTLLNRYQPPTLKPGDAQKGERWAAHVRKLLPNRAESEQVIRWCAHRVQRPGEKVRHAILIGGPPGVGKDTIFEAMLPALGAWNCAAIAPDQLFAPFNEYAAKVFVRINEVVDLHEVSRFKFFEASKSLIAGSPDYVEINPKYGHKFHARNCAGIVMTTNHATTGIHLTPDDRRHFAVETIQLWGTASEREKYFREFWDWLLTGGGFADVAAYLHSVDLREFNPNAPPPKTECFHAIVAHGMAGDTWLMDVLEALGNNNDLVQMVRADVVREVCLQGTQVGHEDFNRRIGPAMARAGYYVLPNPRRVDQRHDFEDRRGTVVLKNRTLVYVARDVPNDKLAELLAGLSRK